MVQLYKPKITLATENINKTLPEYIRKIPDQSFYILGPVDVLSLRVKEEKTPELNSTVTIDGEGIANLKRLERIYAPGLTIGELINILNKEYSIYLKESDVEILVFKYRPAKILTDREVEQPGLFVLQGSASPLTEDNNNNSVERKKKKKKIQEVGIIRRRYLLSFPNGCNQKKWRSCNLFRLGKY